MWNKGFGFLWIKVHTTHLSISFPVCLYVFRELLDCILDIMEFACIFIPKTPPARMPYAISARAVKELIHATDKLFRSLTDGEPYDLIEVNVQNVTVSIKIR